MWSIKAAMSLFMVTKPLPFKTVLPYVLLLIWPVLILGSVVVHPDRVLMQPGSQFSDLLISHWPNAEFLRQALFEYHQFPLWNPSILGGMPFAADPLAGLWYPPNWLAVILPLPFAFNLLFALHLALGGWGFYRWARADDFTMVPALVGGLAFAAMPKIIAHIAAGHLSLVFAVCWLPWLLSLVQSASRSDAAWSQYLRGIALVALVWALTFLADVRWGVMSGVVLVIFWLFTSPAPWLRRVAALGVCLALFLILAAVLWLPLAEFVQLSPRAELTPEEAAVFSLPPNYLIGMMIPNLGGFQEYMTYLGLVPLALALIGIAPSLQRNRRETLVMLGLGLGAFWWALGPNAGLFWVASRLPGLSLLRVPSRAWFIVGLVICWLAVRGASAVEGGWRLQGRAWNLAAVGGAGAAWILAVGGSFITHKPLFNLLVLAFAVTALFVGLRLRWALPILAVAAVAELWFVDASLIEPRPIVPSPVAQWLHQQPGLWRVYSPSYSMPQLDAVQNHLQLADGVDPLQLNSYVKYMESATGVARQGYSVTVPNFAGDVASTNEQAVPDVALLGALNVHYVASEFDLPVQGLILQTTIGRTRLYANALDLGRVQGGALVTFSPNEIVATATGPGRVTFSEIAYPGWVATVDGAPAQIETTGLFRAVTVGAGQHTITLDFRPTLVYIGLGLSGVGLVLLLVIWWWSRSSTPTLAPT